MAYEIELHYGFERSHDTYETYAYMMVKERWL